jgi:hypothetical protein
VEEEKLVMESQLPVCDFCNSPDAPRWYPCKSFVSESADAGGPIKGWDLFLNSIRDWAACTKCAELIDAGDIEGLLAYVIKAYRLEGYIVPKPLADHLRHTYGLFFKNRIPESEVKPDA